MDPSGVQEKVFANLRFKNLILIAGDSQSSFVKKKFTRMENMI